MILPRVYANRIDKEINNNSEYYRGYEEKKVDLTSLKSLFDRRGFGDRISVEIRTKYGKFDEKLVLCRNNYFVNIDNKKIYFDDIIDYQIKK